VKRIFTSLLLVLPLLTPLTSIAETTRYVSDELEITMRSGQGVKFGIRKMLKSGAKLDVIEIDPSGYSKVRTRKGTTGWVLTRYLSNTPSSRNLLEAIDQKAANLELDLANYKAEIQAISSQNATTGSENLSLKETSQRLRKELDDLRSTASNAVGLDNENRQLKEKLQQIDHQIQSLVIENSTLKDSNTKSWFLIGAAVLFGGVILGLVLPRLRLQRKSSWGNL
jgi:SH3 domain protein